MHSSALAAPTLDDHQSVLSLVDMSQIQQLLQFCPGGNFEQNFAVYRRQQNNPEVK